jgi:hypothetical protein
VVPTLEHHSAVLHMLNRLAAFDEVCKSAFIEPATTNGTV